MDALAAQDPWALRLVTDRLPVSPPPYATAALDETQTVRFVTALEDVTEAFADILVRKEAARHDDARRP
ncbi:hypothetical protein ACLGIH_21600 [Streptomyces sp. HMX87]|uniref:hypothetical protein n=1 Tax=Streptomyces sp. HMX87 TaxID=3390849 RepID=UPI003A876227